MADEKTVVKEKKTSFWQGVKQEWQKIIWTDRATLLKQTILVVVISIIMGVMIVVVDRAGQQLVDFLIGIGK
jgi:preprotein translocase subunit SecE